MNPDLHWRVWDETRNRMWVEFSTDPATFYDSKLTEKYAMECRNEHGMGVLSLRGALIEDRFIIMQSTGQITPEGVLIFAGDIVAYKFSDLDSSPTYKGVPKFYKGQWRIESLDGNSCESMPNGETTDYTILGNIYANPDLLQ